MERRLLVLLALFVFFTAVSFLTVAAPLVGLSTVLGVSVLGSSVLGSSVLGSSVLGSSVLGSSVLGSSVLGSSVLGSTTIVEAYAGAIGASQLCLSLVAIGLLVYSELTDPAYGELRSILLELRRSWVPVSMLLVVLFFAIVALKVWSILTG